MLIKVVTQALIHLRPVSAEDYTREHGYEGEVFPEITVILGEHAGFVPDILFTAKDSPLGRLEKDGLHGAPEWVCEVLSPSTRKNDEQEKYLSYLQAGVREYWLVDPDAPAGERFRLFERVTEGTTSGMPAFQRIEGGPEKSRLFPGITIDDRLL